MNNTQLWHENKDINFIMRQDLQSFKVIHPPTDIWFIDEEKTAADAFNNQEVIYIEDAVKVNTFFKQTDLRKAMDKYNLSEVPEATAVFSKTVIDEMNLLRGTNYKIQNDTLLKRQGIIWRITSTFPNDYLPNYDEVFLHWECVLERNYRKQTAKVDPYSIYVGHSPINYTDYTQLLKSDSVPIGTPTNVEIVGEYIYVLVPAGKSVAATVQGSPLPLTTLSADFIDPYSKSHFKVLKSSLITFSGVLLINQI